MRVDQWGVDLVPRTPLAKREQVVTAPTSSFQGAHDLHAAGVRDGVDALDALLGDVVEDRPPLLDRDVGLGDRGQAEVAVLLLVDLAADPEHPDIEQAHRAGQHSCPVKLAPSAHRGQHALTHRRQGAGESEHVLELRVGLLLAPQIVVAVLATACRVHAGCLEVAERVRADPYIPPRGRDRQRSNPSESGRVCQRSSVDVKVGEPGAGSDPRKSRKRRVGPVKPGRAGRGRVFSHDR